ncbi:hypothetical protein MMC22_003183 [Lobaria immixta]|nr:hypothetical protein [Lobaria immixta]
MFDPGGIGRTVTVVGTGGAGTVVGAGGTVIRDPGGDGGGIIVFGGGSAAADVPVASNTQDTKLAIMLSFLLNKNERMAKNTLRGVRGNKMLPLIAEKTSHDLGFWNEHRRSDQ